MICPDCGQLLRRSHSRNFKEAAIKKVTSYKTYRCHECGWRGLVAPIKGATNESRKKVILVWVAGLIIAILIGLYGAYDFSISHPTSGFPPTSGK